MWCTWHLLTGENSQQFPSFSFISSWDLCTWVIELYVHVYFTLAIKWAEIHLCKENDSSVLRLTELLWLSFSYILSSIIFLNTHLIHTVHTLSLWFLPKHLNKVSQNCKITQKRCASSTLCGTLRRFANTTFSYPHASSAFPRNSVRLCRLRCIMHTFVCLHLTSDIRSWHY